MVKFRIKLLLAFLVISCACLTSCGKGEKYHPPTYTSLNEDESEDENIISIPYTEVGGVKMINVTINGGHIVKMVLDSGCSGATITLNDANYLYHKGLLGAGDVLGAANSIDANGNITLNTVINLSDVTIGEKIHCTDVQAIVTNNPNAPLLLGNDILNRAASYEVDNINKVVKFKLN